MTPQERQEFIQDIAEAVRASAPVLNSDELQWVRLAIQKEAQCIKLRQAIIEKTLSSLAWSVLVGVGAILIEWFLQNRRSS